MLGGRIPRLAITAGGLGIFFVGSSFFLGCKLEFPFSCFDGQDCKKQGAYCYQEVCISRGPNLNQTLSELGRTLPSQNIEVSNVTELKNAVYQANSGGNLDIQLRDGTYTLEEQLSVRANNVTIRSLSDNRDDVRILGNKTIDYIFDVKT